MTLCEGHAIEIFEQRAAGGDKKAAGDYEAWRNSLEASKTTGLPTKTPLQFDIGNARQVTAVVLTEVFDTFPVLLATINAEFGAGVAGDTALTPDEARAVLESDLMIAEMVRSMRSGF